MSKDYTALPLLFKVKKAVRYVGLYGLQRTVSKVRAQYHMRRSVSFEESVWVNPGCATPEDPDRCIAIVGCGNFAYSNIAFFLAKERKRFLRLTLDKERQRARSLCQDFRGYAAVANIEQILEDPRVKLVYIASNHASHTEYAVACIRAGKHVHIEKPHAVTEAQLEILVDAMREHPQVKVYLGFNRPRSQHFRFLASHLADQPAPTMMNWFVAGHEIPGDHWYFREEEGGRILGNLCHWTDLCLAMVGMGATFPCTIIPASQPGSKSDFGVTLLFGDGSVGVITFSAKGHTFEGVREILNVHKGNALGYLRDFQESGVEIIDRRNRLVTRRRDHGHAANILNSAKAAWNPGRAAGEAVEYVAATGLLVLKVRAAVESGMTLVVDGPAGRSAERQQQQG